MAVIRWISFLLLLPLLSNCSQDEQSVISQHFSLEEQECFEEEKFLYEPDGLCYTLLSEGPCSCRKARERSDVSRVSNCDDSENRWLVLERQDDGRLHAVCKPCPCCHKTLNVFLKSDGKCHHRTKELRQLCPNNGTELRDNEFGEGECTCVRSPPHARLLGASSGECYPLYRRGPCPQAHVLFPERDPNTLESMARCAPDPCVAHGDGFAQWKADGKCYKLGARGPCDEQSLFIVVRTARMPDCSLPSLAIFDPRPFTRPPIVMPNRGREFGLDILRHLKIAVLRYVFGRGR